MNGALWGFQKQPRDHNLDIQDLRMEHLGQTHKHNSFDILPVDLPRATTRPQFGFTGFQNGALLGRHTNTPVLLDEPLSFQN